MHTPAALLVAALLIAASTATMASPARAVLFGDVDCDSDIDSIDAALILQRDAALVDELPCEFRADVNGDGAANAIDASLVLQFVAGLFDELAPERTPSASSARLSGFRSPASNP